MDDEEDLSCVFEPVEEIKTLQHKMIKGCHVYTGLCDDVMTKWITKTPWDGKISFLGGDYFDTHGQEIIVFENGEDGFEEW